jgi:hypothetical protein
LTATLETRAVTGQGGVTVDVVGQQECEKEHPQALLGGDSNYTQRHHRLKSAVICTIQIKPCELNFNNNDLAAVSQRRAVVRSSS